jgi:hypothetical protein
MIIDMKAERCIAFPPPPDYSDADAPSATESSPMWAAVSYVHGGKLHLATPQTLELEAGRHIDMSQCATLLDPASGDGKRTIAIERLHEQFFPLWRVAIEDDDDDESNETPSATGRRLVFLRLVGLRRKDNNQAVPPADWHLYLPSAV